MNSDIINEADQQFVKKLHHLRTELGARQKAREQNTSILAFGRLVGMVLTLLLCVGAGYAVIHKKQHKSTATSKQSGSASHNDPVSKDQPNSSMGDTLPETGEQVPISTGIDKPETTAQTVYHQDSLRLNSGEDEKGKLESMAPPTPSDEKPSPLRDPTDTDANRVRLVSAIVCDAVNERQPSDERKSFYTGKSSRVYVWMEVRTTQPPFSLAHIYYLNGQRYCEVPLDIKYSRMRTWSYVTLDKVELTGAWKVDIVSNNRTISTVQFVVKDGRAQ